MSTAMKRSSYECSSAGTSAKRTAAADEMADDCPNRMRVYLRVRPLNDRETSQRKTIDVIDTERLVFDPIELDDNLETDHTYGKTDDQSGRRANKKLEFVFDGVFDENIQNIQIYDSSIKEFVNSLLNGYNCAVFAYGATGSGKTATMLGSSYNPGVILFTAVDLFRQIEERKLKLELTISYFEIYNEMVYDLLVQTRKSLAVVGSVCNGRLGGVVQGLSVHQLTNDTHLFEMVLLGNSRRTKHPTDANSESSGSHAVFQISLTKQDFSSSQEMSIQVSKLSLIDLAGSERATTAYQTNQNNSLEREGGNIDLSLRTLNRCITALAQKSPYVPHINSVLTFLLHESLGGNCQTAIIATVSPAGFHYEETLNTLVYADRAKGIQLNFKKNNFSVGLQPHLYTHIMESKNNKIVELTEQVDRLRRENERLQTKIDGVPMNAIDAKADSLEKLNAVKSCLDPVFEERLDLSRRMMDCESNFKKIDLKLLFRKYNIEIHQLMTTDDDETSAPQIDPSQALHNQKLHLLGTKKSLDSELEENESKIRRIEDKLIEQYGEDDWLVNHLFEDQDIKAENEDRAYAEKHALEVAKEIVGHLEWNRDVVTDVVQLVSTAYHCLNRMGRLSEEIEKAFRLLLAKVEGKKSVNWKDDISSTKLFKREEVENLFSLPTYTAVRTTPLANTTRNPVSED